MVFLLTQILGEEGIPTSHRLWQASVDGEDLREVFRSLSSSDQALLRRHLGAGMEEIFSLNAESDPELFFSGILSLGQRALRDGNPPLSGAIFQGMLADWRYLPGLIPVSIRERAQLEINAMNGVGSIGGRFEYLARHFTREASDPGMILGMGVAGTVFSTIRLGVLSRLAARPAAWWTRGLGAGMFASASAFPAEVLAFWGTTRTYSQAVRPGTLRWDRASIGQELASLGLTLGCLKLLGAASGHLFDRVHGINPATGSVARLPGLTRFSRSVFQQFGTLGGIATGHYAEMRLGLRPHTSGDTFWTDSLVTLFQFHVGGRLSQTVMGPRHAARMQELALRTQSLELVRPERPGLWPPFGEVAMTAEGLSMPVPEPEGPSRDHILMMSSTGPKPDRPSSPRLRAPTAPDNSRLEPPFKSLIQGLHNEELSVPERYVLTRELSRELPFARELFGRMRSTREIPTEGPKNLDAMIRDIGMARWEIPFSAVIQSLFNEGISATDRYQLSRELLEDLPIAREVYTKMRGEGRVNGKGSSDRHPNLDSLLYHINIGHFELLSDRMHDWQGRFQFLQHELRGRVNQGSKPRRRSIRNLLESVQLKMLETRRYHNDAESYIGDVKGPSPKSVFEATRYEKLVQRFSDISTRLERYIEGKPVLAKILSRYQSVVPSRRSPRPDFESLEAEIRRSPLTMEVQDLFFQGVAQNDTLLTQYDTQPMNLWLRELNAGGQSRKSRRGWRALGEYLEVATETRNLLGEAGFRQWQIAHEKLLLSESTAETAGPILHQILTARMSGDPTALVNRFLTAVPAPAAALARFRPLIRASSSLHWPELRTQLYRLSERQYLTRETVRGIMEWFEPAAGGSERSSLIHAIREEAVAGIIDFVRKGSHTPEIRRELSQFFEEVVRRRDQRMMAMLAVHFQNYQLGMMRDRLQIRAQPSKDVLSDQMAIEAYDRFLEAIRATSRFYVANPNVRGPYFDVFDKLEGGRESDNALLAAPILQRTQSLMQADAAVELLNRGGLGEALLQVRHADGTETTRSMSSVLDPLAGRAHLEMWLERAERELLHAGNYLNQQNGNHPLILDLQIPNIRPGVSKRDLALWSRDFLELRPMISEIHLAIPERGSVAADPFDPADFRIERVTRSMMTTEALIENRERDLESKPDDVANRLELYRLRQEWAQAAVERNSELGNLLNNPAWREFLSERMQEVEACLTRLRATEQALMGPVPETAEKDSAGEPRPPDLTVFLQQIEHQNQRLQRFQDLSSMAEQITGFRDGNWDLLHGTARRFPRDPGVRSLVHRSVLSLFTGIEKRGGTSLTEDGTLRRGGKAPPYPLEWRRRTFLQAAEMLLGLPLDPARIPSLFDLSSVGYSVRDLRWSYTDRGLALQGDIVPDAGLEAYENYSQLMLGGRRTEFPGEPDSGAFSFRMAREARSGSLHAYFDHLTLPPHLRGAGSGTTFFGELIRLARELKAATIATPDVSGDHRYTLPVYGIRFRSTEDRAKLLSRFRLFLVDYMMKLPEFENYDFSELSRINTPGDLAYAHLDPVTSSLRLNAWTSRGVQGPSPSELPDYNRVGRLFLMNDAPSFDGVFDLKDGSYSMETFAAYVASRRDRTPSGPPSRN